MAHTPGPWDDASNYPGIDSVRIFAKTHYIATVGHSDDPRELTEANARLIAAAPDLLDALKLAQLWLANCMPTGDIDGPKPLPVIAAVLAKVEGT